MKRLILASLFAADLSAVFAATTQAQKLLSDDSNPSDLGNTTVDTSQIINPTPRR
ncbi:hypothetical protein [Leptolyngbya sp. FACHB-711]|uniref:hypothetical protein n=1 Tax=unclassified Leptolyngbya TaxID=2650499 RepID=UPI001685336E|nr:hypothetical protein [Leptolyngbya sp. FACHB-711]MBD1852754.1 hypothetical protein [Cyanobacteria bacterium FACHB-502]MBD2024572.1 hypothetical protein [Leptolyngbya sp. FACHB-711]